MNKWRDLGDVGGVGIQFVLCLAFGYYAGRWLDGRFFGSHGYATGIGALFGVAAAFKGIYDAARRANLRLEQLERDERRDADLRHDERELARRRSDLPKAGPAPDDHDPR